MLKEVTYKAHKKEDYFEFLRENFGGDHYLGLDILAYMLENYTPGATALELADLYIKTNGKANKSKKGLVNTVRRYVEYMDTKASKEELTLLLGYEYPIGEDHLNLKHLLPKLKYHLDKVSEE